MEDSDIRESCEIKVIRKTSSGNLKIKVGSLLTALGLLAGSIVAMPTITRAEPLDKRVQETENLDTTLCKTLRARVKSDTQMRCYNRGINPDISHFQGLMITKQYWEASRFTRDMEKKLHGWEGFRTLIMAEEAVDNGNYEGAIRLATQYYIHHLQGLQSDLILNKENRKAQASHWDLDDLILLEVEATKRFGELAKFHTWEIKKVIDDARTMAKKDGYDAAREFLLNHYDDSFFSDLKKVLINKSLTKLALDYNHLDDAEKYNRHTAKDLDFMKKSFAFSERHPSVGSFYGWNLDRFRDVKTIINERSKMITHLRSVE